MKEQSGMALVAALRVQLPKYDATGSEQPLQVLYLGPNASMFE